MHPALIVLLTLATVGALLCLAVVLCAPSLDDMDVERL